MNTTITVLQMNMESVNTTSGISSITLTNYSDSWTNINIGQHKKTCDSDGPNQDDDEQTHTNPQHSARLLHTS